MEKWEPLVHYWWEYKTGAATMENSNIFGCFRIKADSSSYPFSQPPVANSGQFYLQRKLVEVVKLTPFSFYFYRHFWEYVYTWGLTSYLTLCISKCTLWNSPWKFDQPPSLGLLASDIETDLWVTHWKGFTFHQLSSFLFLQVAFNWLHRHSTLHMLQDSFLSFRIISRVQLLNL